MYTGDLAVLVGAGLYTQPPGSNVLATRTCGLAVPGAPLPPAGPARSVLFVLATTVEDGIEGPLGDPELVRPNDHPCP